MAYYGSRYFGGRYFGPSYWASFPGYAYYGNRYFGGHYFGPRYWGTEELPVEPGGGGTEFPLLIQIGVLTDVAVIRGAARKITAAAVDLLTTVGKTLFLGTIPKSVTAFVDLGVTVGRRRILTKAVTALVDLLVSVTRRRILTKAVTAFVDLLVSVTPTFITGSFAKTVTAFVDLGVTVAKATRRTKIVTALAKFTVTVGRIKAHAGFVTVTAQVRAAVSFGSRTISRGVIAPVTTLVGRLHAFVCYVQVQTPWSDTAQQNESWSDTVQQDDSWSTEEEQPRVGCCEECDED